MADRERALSLARVIRAKKGIFGELMNDYLRGEPLNLHDAQLLCFISHEERGGDTEILEWFVAAGGVLNVHNRHLQAKNRNLEMSI